MIFLTILFYIFIYGIIGALFASLFTKFVIKYMNGYIFDFNLKYEDDKHGFMIFTWMLWPIWFIVITMFLVIGYIPYKFIYKNIVD